MRVTARRYPSVMLQELAQEWASDDDEEDAATQCHREEEFQRNRDRKGGHFPSPPVSPTMARVLAGTGLPSRLFQGCASP